MKKAALDISRPSLPWKHLKFSPRLPCQCRTTINCTSCETFAGSNCLALKPQLLVVACSVLLSAVQEVAIFFFCISISLAVAPSNSAQVCLSFYGTEVDEEKLPKEVWGIERRNMVDMNSLAKHTTDNESIMEDSRPATEVQIVYR